MSALGEERGTRGSSPLPSPLWVVLSAGSSLSVSEGGSGAAGTQGRPARALSPPPGLMRGSGDPRARLRPRTCGPC